MGTYVSNRGIRMVVTLEGNQLIAETPRREKFPYFAESQTHFFDRRPDGDLDVEFVKDDRGAVTHLLDVSRGASWTRMEANAKARGGRFPSQLTVYDRQGKVVRTVGEPDQYGESAFSADGVRLAVVRNPNSGIWVFDPSTGASTQVMAGPAERSWGEPVFSPDGSQVAYFSTRHGYGGLYRKAWNETGREQLVYRFPPLVLEVYGLEWSPDGRFLAFDTDGVLWVLPLMGDRIPAEMAREAFKVSGARFSPDSRFLAYTSDESGRNEVYVRAFDPSTGRFSRDGGRWQVSLRGGQGPVRWRRDGGELYYWAADGGVMAVEVTAIPTFSAGPPRLLFRTPMVFPPDAFNLDFDWNGSISPDGERFAFQVPVPPERKVVAVAQEILARYVGNYEAGKDGDMVVTLEGNQLMLQPPEEEKLPLFAKSETYFFRRDSEMDSDVEFVTDDRGAVTHFLLHQGGPAVTWKRK